MEQITKKELVKTIGKRPLARLYCGKEDIPYIESHMDKFPRIDTLDKDFKLFKVRTNDMVIENVYTHVKTICDFKDTNLYKFTIQNRYIGCLVQFLDKDTRKIRSSVLYIVY